MNSNFTLLKTREEHLLNIPNEVLFLDIPIRYLKARTAKVFGPFLFT